MTSAGVGDADYPIDTRQRLLEVAKVLISQHGFAGTSLQMIADELGFTKAAIYYHFRARDQLLIALMEPLLQQIRHVVETAESQSTPRTQMDAMVRGFAGVVAKNRSLAAIMVFDPSVHRVLQSQPDWGDLIGRQQTLLMQLESGNAGIIKATAVFTGLAGAATGAPVDIDEQSLIEHLAEVGRRILGLRPPRRRSDEQANADSTARRLPEPAPGRWKDFLTEA
jgi:AcrR family transcriptional regulator